ncbi:MAG TPA: PAS domain S-box protein [bacterium]|nr:PAS domain S-box protein [bacterium]
MVHDPSFFLTFWGLLAGACLLGLCAWVLVRRGLRKQVADHEGRFRFLVEHSSEALVLMNPDGTVAYASPSVTNVIGYSPEERVGSHSSDLLHPDDQPAVWEVFNRSLSAPGTLFSFESRIRHKDGRWIHTAAKLRNLVHVPAVGALVLNYHDISAEQEAGEALKRSEALFRALVEQSRETTLLIGPDMDIQYVTANAAFTGYSSTERLGQPVGATTHPDDLPKVRSDFRALLETPGETVLMEYRLRHKLGHWVTVEAVASNRLKDPSIGALVVTCRDVSEARFAQRRQMRLERLAAIGQTAAGLAHEVRNPLAVIVGQAEYLRGQLADRADLLPDIDTILRQSDRLRDLVRDVLERAKPQQPQLVWGSGRDLMERSLKAALLRYGAASEGVEVVRDYAEPPPELRMDLAQMERVLSNLILNALQSMRGRGTLRLALRRGAEGPSLEVADSGPGIEPQDMQRIFEPFFTTKDTGSGLGLWLCRGIVEEHGGRLEASNLAPQGCVFQIQLPSASGREA